MNKNRIEELLTVELETNKHTPLGSLVQTLVTKSIHQQEVDRGQALAALFDLLVGVTYYTKITKKGWILCPNGAPHYFYSYVNVCPRCVLEEKYFYHKAGKGESANIGQAAIQALILFIKEWFQQTGSSELAVFKGDEPVDLVVYDRENNAVFLAEVKSAPLFTLPLVVQGDADEDPEVVHRETDLASFVGARMGLLLPTWVTDGKTEFWEAQMHYFRQPYDRTDDYFINALTELVADEELGFLDTYLQTWERAFEAYATKDKDDAVFWLTGGCGKPSKKVWSAPTSISDGKTSVGMDRTDDIKKGVYQLLKLRMTDVVTEGLEVRVGIVSNAHAARHYDDYILPIENVMWLTTDIEDVTTVADLPADTPVHNLYDGIVTFTKSYTRDSWLQQIFDFNAEE